METTSIPDYPRGVTFEQFWAGLQETRQLVNDITERQKETAERQKETDRQMKENAERQKETDRQMKETDRQMKRTFRQMGFLSNRFGEMAEHLVKPGIYKRFNELGYHFNADSPGGHIIRGEDGKSKAEIDFLLENGSTIMAVEVKTTPKVKHVAEHIKRLEILRDHRRRINDQRKIEGAIAGAIFGIEEREAAIEAGLYVIVQSGDTMKIEVPEDFTPTRW